jgi:hypothetical protein
VIFTLPPPRGYEFRQTHAISPDERALVAVVTPASGPARLWLRRFEEDDGHLLPSTEGASFPFWSPDSATVAFFADGFLRRISIRGGTAAVDITRAENGRGAVWTRSGDVVYAPSNVSGLMRVAAAGGEPTSFTSLDAGRGDISHRLPALVTNTDVDGIEIGDPNGPWTR